MATRRCAGLGLAAFILLAGAPPLASAQPAPPPQAASAERPILLIAQLRSGPVDQTLALQLKPLKTMKEVEAFLKANNIAYGRGRIQVDTRIADSRLVASIARLPPGEIFIVQQGTTAATFNQVIRALTPEDAELVENW